MLRLENIKIKQDISDEQVVKQACQKYKLEYNKIEKYIIFRKSVDARKKENIFYNYTIDIKYNGKIKNKNIQQIDDEQTILLDERSLKNNLCFESINRKKGGENSSAIQKEEKKSNLKCESISKIENEFRPVIVGAGPAGLFCALTLITNGIKPIIIEQGKTVEERQKDVENFIKNGKLNPLSNVQFGEGGAGTFSDGKLTTGLHNKYCKKVLKEFFKFGAPEQILYVNKPHIGTDNLIKIVAKIRNYIISNGGEFLFNSKVTNIEIQNKKVKYIEYVTKVNSLNEDNKTNEVSLVKITDKQTKENETKQIPTDTVILAIGHSARDTFKMLYDKKLEMKPKNFSVGVRIEHKQKTINEAQYGKETKLKLPPAEYKLVYHGQVLGKERSCYTFCMCPGGKVIASSSEENTVVTNGMSTFARDGENANSAVLVEVTPSDLEGKTPLDGIYFQKELEEKAFALAGKNYKAPIQTVGDFLYNENGAKGRKTEKLGNVKPSYEPGTTMANLQEILPDFVTETLKQALPYFDSKIKGFASNDAIMTGIETRSSSPITIIRDENLMTTTVNGIYPCGEGAGYAGGIMSAAIDGIKCAEKIIEKQL